MPAWLLHTNILLRPVDAAAETRQVAVEAVSLLLDRWLALVTQRRESACVTCASWRFTIG